MLRPYITGFLIDHCCALGGTIRIERGCLLQDPQSFGQGVGAVTLLWGAGTNATRIASNEEMDMKHRVALPLLASAALSIAGCEQSDNGQTGATPDNDAAGLVADQPMAQSGMAMAANLPADASPATRGFAEAMDKMNQVMMAPMLGAADQDFMRMMMAHHQGAIDMARVELEHGQNAEARTMAQEVITKQQAEIATIQQWMSANMTSQ